MTKRSLVLIGLSLALLGVAVWFLAAKPAEMPAQSAKGEPAQAAPAQSSKALDRVGENKTTTPAVSAITSVELPPKPALQFGLNGAVTVADVPNGPFRDQLARLAPEARERALRKLGQLHVPVNNVASLSVDRDGFLFFKCGRPPVRPAPRGQLAAKSPDDSPMSRVVAASVPIATPPVRHSKPGASRVIYLDFNGHTITGTAWNEAMDGRPAVASYVAKPYSEDGDSTTFNDAEQANIDRIWQRVAEDYKPFDVDVTTEEPASFTPTTGRILITESKDANNVDMPSSDGGGVAYLDVFALGNYVTRYSPALIYADNEYYYNDYVAEAASHEMGHNLALSHDGTASDEYYGGHGTGESSWAPIMGIGYECNVTQWSKGEYFGANNSEDDLAILSGFLGYRADDHADSNGAATGLSIGGGGFSAQGVIGQTGEGDRFSFSTGASTISISVSPFRSDLYTHGGNLDVLLELINGSGQVIETANPYGTTRATLNTTLAAGTYYLRVSGAGTGSPNNNPPDGYTNYGSLGAYSLIGSFSAATAPSITGHPTNGSVTAGQTAQFTVSATGSPVITYQWQRLPAGSGVWSNLGNGGNYSGVTGTTLSVSGTDVSMSGDQFRCVASNNVGSSTSNAATLTVVGLPTITAQPLSRTVNSGATVSFSVTVSGAGPFGYQWQKNGVNVNDLGRISGAITATLQIANVQAGDAADYRVLVQNSAGEVASDTATLTVNVLPGVVSMASGSRHGLFVRADGTLWGMGNNGNGQLGDGTTINRSSPVQLATGVVAAAAGSFHSLFLKADGTLWGTGSNYQGALGDGTTGSERHVFAQIATGVVAAEAGYDCSYFIKNDGSLWAMGDNTYQRLGDGTGTTRPTPVFIAAGVMAVSAGQDHMLYLKADGTVWSVGTYNAYGQLGNGDTSGATQPAQVASGVKAISAGYQHSTLLKTDGTLWAFGRNSQGQLGDGTGVQRNSPVAIASGVVAIEAGGDRSLYIKADGTLWASGYGYLGTGNSDSSFTPIQVAADVSACSTGLFQSYYVKSDGRLFAFGSNTFGALGDGTTNDSGVPLQIAQGSLAIPASPTGVLPSVGLAAQVRVTWGAVVGATRYEVWRGTSSNFAFASLLADAVKIPLYYDWGVTDGVTYYYWIKAVNPAGASAVSTVGLGSAGNAGPVAPEILGQPGNATVMVGHTATLNVVVIGSPAPACQWQVRRVGEVVWNNTTDGSSYGGSQTNSLTISGSLLGNSGDQYRCVMSNTGGTATSTVATLTVTLLPGDFNGDGVADPGWASPATGQRSVWFMTGTTPSGGVDLGAVEPAVQIATAGDFDGDGKPDFVVQNKVTGERSLWLMDGTSRGGTVSLTTQVLDWQIVFTGDFNADGKTDLVWQNLDTGQAVVWFMNGTTRLSIVDLGIVDPGLQVVGAGDFNGDGKPDFLVQHRRTGQRTIWLMNGLTVTGTISLGTQTLDWELGPAADFNGDGKPDLIWQNTQTGLRMVWLMNGGSMTSALSLGVFPPTWRIVGATDLNHDGQVDLVWQDKSVPPVDFNADGHADLLWQNTQTGAFSLWYMNNLASVGSVALGTQALAWQIVGAADFNGDGKGDILWQNNQTGLGEIWLMNGVNLSDVISLGTQELVWKIGGAADFNGDGQVDLLWQNTRTGQRSLWYMNGPNLGSAVDLGFQTLDWQICGAGDFNGDGQAEIIWQNTQTGQRTLWFMNGRQLGSAVDLGILSTAWQIVGAADMDGDGQADILMQNTQTGLRRVWIMDGFHINTAVDLTTQPVSWQIAN